MSAPLDFGGSSSTNELDGVTSILAPPLVLVLALVGIMVKLPEQDLMRAVGISMLAVLAATVGLLVWRRAP